MESTLAVPEARLVSRETEVLTAPGDSPALVYLASLSAGSQRSMASALGVLARLIAGGEASILTLPWHGLRFQHTQAVRSKLAERFSVAYANKILSALKGVLKAAWRLGQMPTEEFQRAVDLPPVRGSSLPKGRALKTREQDKLFAKCEADATPAGARDGAILAILLGAGLRRSEVVALDLADYDAQTGEIKVRSGKGNKSRITYAGKDARIALDDYLDVRGLDAGPLFLPTRKGRPRRDGTRPTAQFEARRLSDQSVWDILAKRGKAAGVPAFAPHDTRRTFISELLDAGADIATVQKLAGHSSVTTTARYDRRGEKTKRGAAELLHLGVKRRK